MAAAKAALNKALPKDDSFVEIDENKLTKSMPHLPTGSVIVDYIIGGRPNKFGVRPCPGLPRGRLVNLYGMESSGKTTLALMTAVSVCQQGGSVCFIDWENAIDMSYAASLGIPTSNGQFELVQPETLEKGLSIIWTMAKAGVDLIIIDSVGAGVPQAALDQKISEKGDMGRVGLMAAKWSKFLPELKGVITRSRSCIVGISQLRKKINTGPFAHGDGTTAQGGEAWKFYSEVRIMLRRVQQEKGKEYNALTHKIEEAVVGQTTRIKIDKCKISSAQGKEGDFYIRFGDGIDDLRSIIDIASNHGLIKKSGAWYNWIRSNGETIRGCGMDAFKKEIRQTEGVWPELYKMTVAVMSETLPDNLTVVETEEDEYGLNEAASFIITGSETEEETQPSSEESE